MRHAAFTEDEIARFLKALYLTGTKKDSREAWSVLDRRRTGTIARHEVEDALCDILGDECRRKISQLLNRLPSHGNAYAMNESVILMAVPTPTKKSPDHLDDHFCIAESFNF